MAKNGKPEQYRGPLSPSEVAYGMNAAARNARRLHEDAQILLKAQRFPSAASLAILSIEEAGKLALLRGIATAPTAKLLKDAWRDYRNHREKNVAWIILDLARRGATKLTDLREIFDRNSDHPTVLDSVKQLGFYTDCYANRHWSEPHEVIDADLARALVMIASILRPKHETSTREMELWVEHLGAQWGAPNMFDAAIRFHKALHSEGLGRHDPDEVMTFFGIERGDD